MARRKTAEPPTRVMRMVCPDTVKAVLGSGMPGMV